MRPYVSRSRYNSQQWRSTIFRWIPPKRKYPYYYTSYNNIITPLTHTHSWTGNLVNYTQHSGARASRTWRTTRKRWILCIKTVVHSSVIGWIVLPGETRWILINERVTPRWRWFKTPKHYDDVRVPISLYRLVSTADTLPTFVVSGIIIWYCIVQS